MKLTIHGDLGFRVGFAVLVLSSALDLASGLGHGLFDHQAVLSGLGRLLGRVQLCVLNLHAVMPPLHGRFGLALDNDR